MTPQEMKFILIISLITLPTLTRSEELNYQFKLDGNQPKLEIKKSGQSENTANPFAKADKAEKAEEQAIIAEAQGKAMNANQMMAPIIQLGNILKEVTDTLKEKKQKKKAAALKRKKLRLKKAKKAREKRRRRKLMKKGRKAFDMGAAAGIAGGAAVLGGGAMAMGAADNDEIQRKIDFANDEFGILKISEKVDDDMNQLLFTAAQKIRGLRLDSKTIMLNGEKRLDQLYDSVDHVMGSFESMDKHIFRKWMNGGDEEEGE